ncbi:MAG TPA: hypothetical protein VFE32_18305 [Puia sp.]|nr:hypothetical protein [Puia sp.]
MRKLVAFILLVPFSILLIGSVSLSSVCPVVQPEACSSIQGPCCHQEKCPARDEPQKGRPDRSDRPACCFDCPLCALITVQPFIRFELTPPQLITEYAVRPDNLLTGYYQHHWKPPCILFS